MDGRRVARDSDLEAVSTWHVSLQQQQTSDLRQSDKGLATRVNEVGQKQQRFYFKLEIICSTNLSVYNEIIVSLLPGCARGRCIDILLFVRF